MSLLRRVSFELQIPSAPVNVREDCTPVPKHRNEFGERRIAAFRVHAVLPRIVRVVFSTYVFSIRVCRSTPLADVAGKGLPAALLMSSLQAALSPLICQGFTPPEVCQRLNRALCDLTPDGKFITFFYAVLDSVDNRLRYCNAGHNPPLLIRADGAWTQLKATGAVLGQFHEWLFEQKRPADEKGRQVTAVHRRVDRGLQCGGGIDRGTQLDGKIRVLASRANWPIDTRGIAAWWRTFAG